MVMAVGDQFLAMPALMPLKLITLLPWTGPKSLPKIVIAAPAGSAPGEGP